MSEGRPSKSEGRLSKADLDTGWSKDDGRQCSLCQKYGDAKSNVSKTETRFQNTSEQHGGKKHKPHSDFRALSLHTLFQHNSLSLTGN